MLTSEHAGLCCSHSELGFEVFGSEGGESHEIEVEARCDDAADEDGVAQDATDRAWHV